MSNAQRRRAYIGNLRPRPNLTDDLYNNLFLPHGLPVKNYPPNNNGDNDNDSGGIVVAQPKMSNNRNQYAKTEASSHYALVEFSDVGYAIRVLNGVQFDGRTLRVSREKTNFGDGRGRNNGGFGSSRWAGDDSGAGTRNFKAKQQKHKENGDTNGSASNYVKTNAVPNNNGGLNKQQSNNVSNDNDLNGEEAIIRGVESIISSEIKESSDEVTAAIACTAAMTLLSSIDAFGLGERESRSSIERYANIPVDEAVISEPKNEIGDGNDTMEREFRSRRKLPMSELMAEYGEQDVDWKKQQMSKPNKQPQDDMTDNEKDLAKKVDFQSRCQIPLSDLMAEYGEQDSDWKKYTTTHDNTKQKSANNTEPRPRPPPGEHKNSNNNNNNNDDGGMLGFFGKASIHLELVSFGYKYGAPPHSRRGFTYAQPLPPSDIRDLDRAPGHVSKFTGLSYLVKRVLLNPSSRGGNDDDGDHKKEEEEGNDNGSGRGQGPSQGRMRLRANKIADEVVRALVESIDEGGHGAISPLTMTIPIGSEYGRHRAVVLVEHLAVIVRARLRRNDGRRFNDTGEDTATSSGKGNGIVRQPVSVGTRHRDVEARHRDEEAFGEDLKREAKRVEKEQARKRRMDGGGGWDDDDRW